MGYPGAYPPTRPTSLTILIVVSFIASVATVLGVVLRVLLATFLSAATWLLGPVVGMIGSLTGIALVVVSVLQSLLSLLLFSAAVQSFEGDPRGRENHRIWAWIVIVLDVLRLVVGASLSRLDLMTLLFAGAVLYVTNLPETLAYFRLGRTGKPANSADWWA